MTVESKDALIGGIWTLTDSCIELNYKGVQITLEPRPTYCDRGNWIAKITKPGPLDIDDADMFPRYYFYINNAFKELESFLHKRKELKVTPSRR